MKEKESTMRIGILGSGLMGAKLGTIFARTGHETTFSYARSMEKLNKLADDAAAKARAGTPREATEEADALLLAQRRVNRKTSQGASERRTIRLP